MPLPSFPTSGTAKPAATITIDQIKKNDEELKKAREAQAVKDAAMKQADELDKKRMEATLNAQTPLTREVMLDELKDPEVELRAKEAREAMATDKGVKARAAAAAVPASVDKYQKEIEEPRTRTAIPYELVIPKAPDLTGRQSAPQGPDPAEKSPADSATEIANASPSQVGEVIEKLKEEEKKGGPNFFDIIEAAAAGWNGKIPLYVQKEIAKTEEQATLDRLKTQAAEEAAQQSTAYAREKEIQAAADRQAMARLDKQIAADKGIASLAPIGTPGTLSVAGFMGGQ